MNSATGDITLPEPPLSVLIDEGGPEWNSAWNHAFPTLQGIAQATVPAVIKQADHDLVDHLFKESLRKVRNGLKVKRASSDPEVGKSWKMLRDFGDLRNLFVEIVAKTTVDYVRKHNRERPYDDQIEFVSDEIDTKFDFEWQWAFRTALNRVNSKYREILIGMFIMELDTKQLMKIHDLSKGTIAGRTRLGKEELREIILNDYELCLILCPEEAKEKNKK